MYDRILTYEHGWIDKRELCFYTPVWTELLRPLTLEHSQRQGTADKTSLTECSETSRKFTLPNQNKWKSPSFRTVETKFSETSSITIKRWYVDADVYLMHSKWIRIWQVAAAVCSSAPNWKRHRRTRMSCRYRSVSTTPVILACWRLMQYSMMSISTGRQEPTLGVSNI